jgi:hypothetical protein
LLKHFAVVSCEFLKAVDYLYAGATFLVFITVLAHSCFHYVIHHFFKILLPRKSFIGSVKHGHHPFCFLLLSPSTRGRNSLPLVRATELRPPSLAGLSYVTAIRFLRIARH